MGLTAVILTNQEIVNIRETIDSVSFANEIILVKDGHPILPKVFKEFTIFFRPLADDFAGQRNYGLSRANEDWVLFVDDDEIVTAKLAEEINRAIKSEKFSGYFLRRLDRYHSQILNHGETGKMKILRLARKTAGRFVRPVHEVWEVKGKKGELHPPLFHERGELVAPFIERMVHYGPIDAKELTKEGKTFSLARLLLNPIGKFFLNYNIKLGFLDGYAGLFQAYLMSVQSLSVRVFQWPKH